MSSRKKLRYERHKKCQRRMPQYTAGLHRQLLLYHRRQKNGEELNNRSLHISKMEGHIRGLLRYLRSTQTLQTEEPFPAHFRGTEELRTDRLLRLYHQRFYPAFNSSRNNGMEIVHSRLPMPSSRLIILLPLHRSVKVALAETPKQCHLIYDPI